MTGSVGSPGGAGGNEIEAVARAIHHATPVALLASHPTEMRLLEWSEESERRKDVWRRMAFAALDAVKRSPQNEDHELCDECGYWRSPTAPCKCGKLATPQDEDHEAGIRAAVNAYYERPLDEPLAPGTSLTHFERAVAAYLSRRPSPVSGTEPMVEAERMEHWKNRAVDAEMKLTQVSGTEPDTATLVAYESALRRIASQGPMKAPNDPWTHWSQIAREALEGR